MRFACAAAVLTVALAACGSSSAASQNSTPGSMTSTSRSPSPTGSTTAARCGPAGAKTLRVDRRARVYAVGGAVYGCANGSHARYRLGLSTRSIRGAKVGPIALAGTDAAYGLTRFGVDTGSAEVIVRDLAGGRQLHAADATTTGLVEAVKSVTAIVVKGDGAVAWIGQVQSIISRGKRAIEVQRIDARGQSLLDSSPAIDVRSLRRHGSRLAWRDGSATRSATLR